MGIQFNLDGSITNTPDSTEQEQLEARVVNFENIKQRRFDELRNYRNNLLIRSDWTIINDSPLPVGIQSSWREYRQNLRDLPNQPNAPDRFLIAEWPLSPEQTEIPDDAKIFVAEISDPLGIGTTSWVGIGTNGEYVDELIN
jgi:hypothetical protein